MKEKLERKRGNGTRRKEGTKEKGKIKDKE
jgi:hypothetical protein